MDLYASSLMTNMTFRLALAARKTSQFARATRLLLELLLVLLVKLKLKLLLFGAADWSAKRHVDYLILVLAKKTDRY